MKSLYKSARLAYGGQTGAGAIRSGCGGLDVTKVEKLELAKQRMEELISDDPTDNMYTKGYRVGYIAALDLAILIATNGDEANEPIGHA